MNVIKVFFVCLLVSCVFSVEGPSDYFSSEDASGLVKMVQLHQKGGSFLDNVGDTHYAVKILKNLGVEVSSKNEVCAYAEKGLEGDIESIYHSVQVIENVGCQISGLSSTTKDTITSSLQSESLLDLFHAAITVQALRHANLLAIELADVYPIVGTITALADLDQGTFKRTPEQAEGSPYYAGLAFSALAKLYPDLPPEEKESIDGTFELISTLISSGESESNTLYFSHQDNSVSRLTTTYSVVRGILDLTRALNKSPQLGEEEVLQLANYFIQQKYTGSIIEANSFLGGLLVSNDESFKRPIVLSLLKASVNTTAKGEDSYVKVKVTDIFGNSNGQNSVFLVRATSKDETTPLVSNQELKLSSEPGIYQLNFLAAKPDPGVYVLKFRVTPEARDKWQSVDAQKLIKIVATIKADDLEISVSDKFEEELSSDERKVTVQFRHQLSEVIRVDSFQSLNLKFKIKSTSSGKAVLVHQPFIRFTNQQTKRDSFFVAKSTSSKAYKFSLLLEKSASVFNNESGDYNISLLIGDANVDNSFEWTLGTVNLQFEGKPQSKKLSGPKPVIEHQFRLPAKLAPALISSVFTIAVLAPLAVLIFGIMFVGGFNFSNFPKGTASLFALGFEITFGAIIVLYYLFWIRLNLFQTLGALTLLGTLSILFGNKVLRSLALIRTSTKSHTD